MEGKSEDKKEGKKDKVQYATTTAVISRNCSACVVDLLEQGTAFNFTEDMVGDYKAELVTGDDCKVSKRRMNFKIQVTLTPAEVRGESLSEKCLMVCAYIPYKMKCCGNYIWRIAG